MSEFVCEVAPDEFGELTEVARLGEEIVRCRYCRHYQIDHINSDTVRFCLRLDALVDDDGYCAWGEKR